MINSNNHKLALCGWLKENNPKEYSTPLKLQKFLLFYELFSKFSNESIDFSFLRGYKRGPVFSDVWGDYTKEKNLFNKRALQEYKNPENNLNNERARHCAFIVQILSDNDLSNFTHKLNLWNSKRERIDRGEKQVSLNIEDFNKDDEEKIKLLMEMYPLNLIENSEVVEVDNHFFIFSKEDYKKFTSEHYDVLCSVVQADKELQNPIYVEIDKNGRLLID